MSSNLDDVGHGHSRKANRADASSFARGDNEASGPKKKAHKPKIKGGGKGRSARGTADDRSMQQTQDDGYVPEHIRLENEKEEKRRDWQRKHDGEESSEGDAGNGGGSDDEGGREPVLQMRIARMPVAALCSSRRSSSPCGISVNVSWLRKRAC
jgi:hypothetical protein